MFAPDDQEDRLQRAFSTAWAAGLQDRRRYPNLIPWRAWAEHTVMTTTCGCCAGKVNAVRGRLPEHKAKQLASWRARLKGEAAVLLYDPACTGNGSGRLMAFPPSMR